VHVLVGEFLDQWAAGKRRRPGTLSGYKGHIRNHLKPRIGYLRVDRLNLGHLVAMFDAITDANEEIEAENQARREQVERCRAAGPGRPAGAERKRLEAERAHLAEMKPFRRTVSPATVQRIRATLRAALNSAISQQIITFNPAAHVELDAGKRPKPLLWTAERVEQWQKTGERPGAVMVWSPEQIGRLLDQAVGDRLYALFHLVAFRGLRRGEAVGLRWTDVDLENERLSIAVALTQDGWTVIESLPKSDSGVRTIALDAGTVQVLRAHRVRQAAEKLHWGSAWTDTGRVFTKEDGTWLHPSAVTDRFIRLAEEAGLPPIRFHDLRHGAATLIHAAGGDLHAIKEVLGHSTIALTSDTYTNLLPEVDKTLAEAAFRLVPRAPLKAVSGAGAPAALPQSGQRTPAPRVVKASRTTKGQLSNDTADTSSGGPRGVRTHNLRIKSPQLCQLS